MLEIAEFSAGLGQGGSEEALECQRQAFAIYHALGDRKGESDVYFSLGMRQAYKQELDGLTSTSGKPWTIIGRRTIRT